MHQFLDHLSFHKKSALPDYSPINRLVNRKKQILYLDFDLLLKFQQLTNSFFEVGQMPSIYSIILQESFYEYANKMKAKFNYSQIVFAKHIAVPFNYMDFLNSEK